MITLNGDSDQWGWFLRDLQEQELEARFAVTEAEFALAREAAAVSQAFQAADLRFDPRTLIVLRILEGLVAEEKDAVAALRMPEFKELITRSTQLTSSLLCSSP